MYQSKPLYPAERGIKLHKTSPGGAVFYLNKSKCGIHVVISYNILIKGGYYWMNRIQLYFYGLLHFILYNSPVTQHYMRFSQTGLTLKS
jgi:hypothetical protein